MINSITIIILTFNEENKIKKLLDSIKDVTKNIFVVDSYSKDNTVNILKEYEINYTEHPFENYSKQRNWAQKNEPFGSEWVMHLDADEPISPALANWLKNDFKNMKDNFNGFLFSRKTYFLGRWIKHGGQYPSFHLRLYKKTVGRCENKAYDQHFVLKCGDVKRINGADIYNAVADNIDNLILSHNKWATLEAKEILSDKREIGEVKEKLFGNPIERRRWLKVNIFEKSPLFLRSFLYFIYKYIIRLGFLDGKEGFIFYVLQSFWFRFLIDAKVYEMEIKDKESSGDIKEVTENKYEKNSK